MKKIIGLLVAVILLLLSVSTTAGTVFAASLSDRLIIQLTETHTESQIDINVKLVTNTGVSGMTLELLYNQNVFEFNGYDRGTALENLDLISTDLSVDPTLPVKFNWLTQNVSNDFSTGTILTIHFNLKPNSSSGEYEIGFKYNTGDIIYIDNYHTQSKSAIISKAVVNISENKITDTKIVEASTHGDTNWFLIIGVSAIAISIVTATTLIIMKNKRKKRKKNWLEI